jgi:hypothetical protein
MIKQLVLTLVLLVMVTNSVNAQDYPLDSLLKKLESKERSKMYKSPNDYNDVVLGLANYIYNNPIDSINVKYHYSFKSYLEVWMNKTDEYWFNFKVPSGRFRNNDIYLVYLACNVKYCLENPGKGKKNDEEETNYQAFLLFIDYFSSEKVNENERSQRDIQDLLRAKEKKTIKDLSGKEINYLKYWVNR